MKFRHMLLSTVLPAASLGAVALSSAVSAQERQSAPISFDIPTQSMDATLRDIARRAGIEIFFDATEVRALMAPAIRGQMTVKDALALATQNSPLLLELTGTSAYVRLGKGENPGHTVREAASERIVVTGSRIAGAARSSSVITVTSQDMRDAGQYQLGDMVRATPQNFNGGQNPGVVVGTGRATDINVNSATAVNLRGLGADATLTLLNGKRLAYDSAIQAIDISAIPAVALDRVEILTEGASAIYGSDAVAGVVNVVLKKNYEGLDTVARFGAATDGGNVEQQYSAVAGRRWTDGGVMVALDYGRNSEISAGSRSYTQTIHKSTTLLPRQEHYGAVINASQTFGGLTFDFDGLYNKRNSRFGIPFSTTQSYFQFGNPTEARVMSFTASPRLTLDLGSDWSASVLGTYGKDKTWTDTGYYQGGALIETYLGQYDNRVKVVEASAEGPLLSLPGGQMRVAVGGGYRSNRLIADLSTQRPTGSVPGNAFDRSNSSTYMYAEANLPLVSSLNRRGGIEQLILTGALRYEHYSSFGSIATPKIGAVYAPVEDLVLRASWGKSFKAPTLRQQYSAQRASLDLPSYYSATGYPAGATILEISGGNADLEPEKATTWSVGALIKPRFLPNLRLEASYFNTDYRDRVVTPITRRTGALTNRLYAQFIQSDPDEATVNASIAAALAGLQNYSGQAFEPSDVAVIVDNRNHNATRQTIEGVDISAGYKIETRTAGSLSLSASVTYLKSEQELLPGQARTQLAGIVFNPAHWRGRGGIIWRLPDVTAAAYMNRIGSLEDNRFPDIATVKGMTTADFNLRFEPMDGILQGTAISMTALNIFNAKPGYVRPLAAYVPAYDSTNFSSVGRYVGLTLERRW